MTNEELIEDEIKKLCKELSDDAKLNYARYHEKQKLESHFIMRDINDKLNLSLVLNIILIGFCFILYFK